MEKSQARVYMSVSLGKVVSGATGPRERNRARQTATEVGGEGRRCNVICSTSVFLSTVQQPKEIAGECWSVEDCRDANFPQDVSKVA